MTPQRLIEWRESRNLTRTAAAELTGTSRNSWPRWEAPDGKPPKYLAYVIAAISFGLPPYE